MLTIPKQNIIVLFLFFPLSTSLDSPLFHGFEIAISRLNQTYFITTLIMEVLYKNSNNSTLLKKTMHDLAIISTLSKEVKNKRDFDTVNYSFETYHSTVSYNNSLRDLILNFCPDLERREKFTFNFYFHTSLWCLKRFYEGLKGTKKHQKDV